MRAVVPTIGSQPYGTSKYLVKIIQPNLNKIKHKVSDSSSSVEQSNGINYRMKYKPLLM